MSTILEQIKTKIEVDSEENIFDSQLLLSINSSIAYLIKNGIPISFIEENSNVDIWQDLRESDINLVIDFIYRDIIPEFDRDLLSSSTTINYLSEKNTDILYYLKSVYDVGKQNEV